MAHYDHAESSVFRDAVRPRLASSDPTIYPSNVAAACLAASSVHQQPLSTDMNEVVKREKRRTINRLSARRWRKQKKCRFSNLQDQIQALENEQKELALENAKLQAELRFEMASMQTQTQPMPLNRTANAQIMLRPHHRDVLASASLNLLAMAQVNLSPVQSFMVDPSSATSQMAYWMPTPPLVPSVQSALTLTLIHKYEPTRLSRMEY